MKQISEDDLKTKLRESLSDAGFAHCRRTSQEAARLAKIYQVDEGRAIIAGLVHDIAKDYSDSELIKQALLHNIDIDPIEESKPYLLHAAVGAKIIRRDFGIQDDAIVSAVIKHTLGDTNMSKLDKIIYLADVIEPKRCFAGLEEIRALAEVDLDKAFAKAYQGQLIFIIEKGGYLHPKTIEVWNDIASEVRRDNGTNKQPAKGTPPAKDCLG